MKKITQNNNLTAICLNQDFRKINRINKIIKGNPANLRNLMKIKVQTIIILFAFFCNTSIYAQSTSVAANTGKDFYIAYLNSSYGGILQTLQLKVVVEEACSITARYNIDGTYWNGWNKTWVTPGIYTANVTLANMMNGNTLETSTRSITLTATKDVCVYTINYVSASTDGTCVLPVPAWGTDYRLVTGYPRIGYYSAYAVVASQPNTQVTLHNGSTIILQKNEVYHYYCDSQLDMTGQRVTANKPIALFSGSNLVNGPGQTVSGISGFGCSSLGGTSGDHLYEQLWSIEKWGTDFFAFPIDEPNGNGNWGGIIGFVAHENGTNVTVSGGINGGTPLVYNLDAGGYQYLCYVMSGLTRIISNKPIMVFNILPDATLITIPATIQRIGYAKVSSFILSGTTNIKNHGIDILLPAAAFDATVIKEGGTVVPLSSYTKRTSTDFLGWITLRKELPNVDKTIEITSPAGFLAYMSGSGSDESYGYVAGASAFDISYFTVNGIPHQKFNDTTVCVGVYTFEIAKGSEFLYPKWYINGVEEVAASGSTTWNKNLDVGTYTVRVDMMDVVDKSNVLQQYTTAFTVMECVDVCSGKDITFESHPTDEGTDPSYQWFVNGSPIGGATATTYSYTPTDGDIVTCLMTTDPYCASTNTAISNSYLVKVSSGSASIVTPSPPAAVCSGETLTLTPPAVLGGLTQVGAGTWTLNGVDFLPPYTVDLAQDGHLLVYKINTAECGIFISNSVPIAVMPKDRPRIRIRVNN